MRGLRFTGVQLTIYQRDYDARDDSEFEPGSLELLVTGNHGRLCDSRRNPIRIVGLRLEAGYFVVRIEDFEDKGAEWEIPFEQVSQYQFALGSQRAGPETVAAYRSKAKKLGQPLIVEADREAATKTEAWIRKSVIEAEAWLLPHSTFLAAGEKLPEPDSLLGSRTLAGDLPAILRFSNKSGSGGSSFVAGFRPWSRSCARLRWTSSLRLSARPWRESITTAAGRTECACGRQSRSNGCS